MSRNSRHTFNFSINPNEHLKVLDIFDQWDKQGLNFSGEICKSIKFYQADKERGAKIDRYVEPFQLLKLPYINQELKDEDIEALAISMTGKDFIKLSELMELNYRKIIKAIYSPNIIYKKIIE